MKSKSKVRQLVQSFYIMVHTQFAIKIKAIRIDNAKEFDILDFLHSNGIIHQHNCVYTLQQNSVVKRKLQHLLSIARALQIQSHLPIQFWGDCVLTAAYLINRLPSPLLNNKTPFDLLFKKSPDYSHLKVFGCLCFVSTISQTKNKFYPKLGLVTKSARCYLHEEIYMALPPRFHSQGEVVRKLNKSLYGLKQASRQWFAKFSSTLI